LDPKSDRLLTLAGAVVDGAPVSWDDEARSCDEESLAVLQGLRELAGIIDAHRHVSREFETTAKRPEASVVRGIGPSHWRHLVVLDKIGEGSFGTVYRAYDSQLAIDVALKLLSRSDTPPLANPDRVLNEARLLARVRHENVVAVYGADDTGDYVGLWMEFIKGRTLADLLRTQGTFGAHEAALIGRDLCRAVSAVHHAGILHGDIKAHNVMRQEGGRIVLMDFGAGHSLINERSRSPRNVIGTPTYLAPEVLDGSPPTKSSDIYALGVLLYHLATGSYPVSRQSLPGIVEAHKVGERQHLRDVRPDLPDDFVRIVEQATAVEPARRFASAGAFEAALARMTSPISPQPQGQTVPAVSGRLLAVLAVLGVLVAAVLLWSLANKPTSKSADSAAVAPSSPPSDVAATYDIDAAFYRKGRNGEELLVPGGRIAPGDELFLKVQASVPINLYVVNEDEKGESILEFPLPGQLQANPIQPGQQFTLPGPTMAWQVTSPGEHEHFLVFASPDRLDPLKEAFAELPSPKENAPVIPKLPSRTIERLRAVGGLTVSEPKQNAGLGLFHLFTTPLTNARETTHGLWVRQLTLENPGQ